MLTVEDGTGLANADALISQAYFESYSDARGFDYAPYTDAQIEAAIRRASSFMSNSYSWKGYRLVGRSQALAWPRLAVYDTEGLFVPSDEIPIEVQQATAEVTQRELVAPGSMTPDVTASAAVKREKIGEIEVEYANAVASNQPVLTIVRDLIGGLLAVGAGNGLVGFSYRA